MNGMEMRNTFPQLKLKFEFYADAVVLVVIVIVAVVADAYDLAVLQNDNLLNCVTHSRLIIFTVSASFN